MQNDCARGLYLLCHHKLVPCIHHSTGESARLSLNPSTQQNVSSWPIHKLYHTLWRVKMHWVNEIIIIYLMPRPIQRPEKTAMYISTQENWSSKWTIYTPWSNKSHAYLPSFAVNTVVLINWLSKYLQWKITSNRPFGFPSVPAVR